MWSSHTPDDEYYQKIIAERYEQFRFDCLYVAMSILKNQALAEDAVHDAFVAVMEHKEKYYNLPCSDFRKLIVIIVKNKCFDILRHRKRILDISLEDLEPTIESKSLNIEELITQRIESEHVYDYLCRIDRLSREILQMKYELGMSYKEIAAALHISIKNVEVRIARAKQKVRNLASKDENYEK